MAHDLLSSLATHPDRSPWKAVRLSAEEPTASDCQSGHTAADRHSAVPGQGAFRFRHHAPTSLFSLIAELSDSRFRQSTRLTRS
jgi:hypothetical protein